MLCKVRSGNGYGFLRPGLKTGVENAIFWSEIGSGFGDVGGTPPPKIPRSTSPPPPPPPVFQKIWKSNSQRIFRAKLADMSLLDSNSFKNCDLSDTNHNRLTDSATTENCQSLARNRDYENTN